MQPATHHRYESDHPLVDDTTEQMHVEDRVVGNGFLNKVETELSGNGVVKKSISIDHTEVLELYCLLSDVTCK